MTDLKQLLFRTEIEDVLVRHTRVIHRLDSEALGTCSYPEARMVIAGNEISADEFRIVVMAMLRELELTRHRAGRNQNDPAYRYRRAA